MRYPFLCHERDRRGTYTIPLNLPPGVGGVEPKLEFVHNSQRGDGPLGVGWALSGLSAITRCPQTMAQDGVRGAVNYDGNDRYCVDGQRLVVVSGTYGVKGAAYRTEIESQRRIVQTGPATDGDPTGPVSRSFVVTTKDGLTMSYGTTEDSRVQVTGRTTHLAWLLASVTDRLGNHYDVAYLRDTANGVAYPTRVDYTANAGTALKAASSVLFDYDARAAGGAESPPRTYHAGSLAGRYTLRLAKVRTTTDAGARAVLEYRLGYGSSPSTGRPRIESVTLCTAAGQCLPATTFAFAAPEAQTRLTNASVPAFGKRSANPSIAEPTKLRTLRWCDGRTQRGGDGQSGDGAPPGTGCGISGIWAEGEGVVTGQWRAIAQAGELVRACAALARAA